MYHSRCTHGQKETVSFEGPAANKDADMWECEIDLWLAKQPPQEEYSYRFKRGNKNGVVHGEDFQLPDLILQELVKRYTAAGWNVQLNSFAGDWHDGASSSITLRKN